MKTMSNDKTNPSHYQFGGGVEVIHITQHLGFLLGNVVKYSARAGRKDGEAVLDDLYKARWYLNRQIEIEEELNGKQTEQTEALDGQQHPQGHE